MSRYSENPRPGKTRSKLFEKKNPVAMAKEWFNDKQIWMVLFHQLTRDPFISCECADSVPQVTVNNRSHSFSRDRAVVSDKYRKLSRGERSRRNSRRNPHNSLTMK